MDKLPEILTEKQKKKKITNLLNQMSVDKNIITNIETKKYPKWIAFKNK